MPYVFLSLGNVVMLDCTYVTLLLMEPGHQGASSSPTTINQHRGASSELAFISQQVCDRTRDLLRLSESLQNLRACFWPKILTKVCLHIDNHLGISERPVELVSELHEVVDTC